MDRDEALAFLRGGNEGIVEWNRRREAGEDIPELVEANLSDANLSGANLSGTDLSHANLIGSHLSDALLIDANLRHANFRRANLSCANLSGANLRDARLIGANLSDANLSGANLTQATIVNANLCGTNLSGSQIFGTSVWRVATDGRTVQNNLVVSDPSDPVLTIDNLKVAQFIYLLLNNEEIRGVIDTITSKVVLILGRFTPERKVLLDAIREELRHRDYLPVMFDFEKPNRADIRKPSRRWRGWHDSLSPI